MKRIIVIAALLMAYSGLKAQDCDAIMLPYFNYNQEQVDNYREEAPEKFDYRCTFARAAFYESDTIPKHAVVVSINGVKCNRDGQYLTGDFVVDINTLSYYGYNFNAIQMRFPDTEICFETPASRKAYLVLRTRDYMTRVATQVLNN